MMVKTLTTLMLLGLTMHAANSEESSALPRVEVETTHGRFVLELYPEKAPLSVENFLGYVQDGFYEGLIFHRVIKGFMAQGGGFTTDYEMKKTGEPIENESRNGLSNERGTVAMARTNNPHSANTQFFINLVDNPRLDGNEFSWGYAVFGRIVDGIEVVDNIAAIPTGPAGPFRSDAPQSSVIIKKMHLSDKES